MPNKLPRLVFLHIPKSGGRTFRQSILEKFYKKSKIKIDRLDRQVFWNYNKDVIDNTEYPVNYNKYDLITGHFIASKYMFLYRPIITIFRNPIDRLISNYYWWKKSTQKDKIIKKLFDNNIDIVDFSEVFENYMSHIVDINLSDFGFIGILENFDETLDKFKTMFNVDFEYDKKIRNKGCYTVVSKDIRDKIAKNNKDDLDLYNRAMDIFKGYKIEEK